MGLLKMLFGGGSKPAPRKAARNKQSRSKPFKVPRAPEGQYSWPVAGESNYQDAIKRLAGGPGWSGPAVLVAETKNKYDPNAVRVDVGGKTVGYLPRHLAEEFQGGVLKQPGARYPVTAFCVGGEPGKPHLGVVLQFDPRPLR